MTDKKRDIEKLIADIEALEVETEQSRAVVEITPDTKLSILWAKVQPYVMLLGTIVRGKVKTYLNAFVAAMNVLVAKEDDEE